MRDLRSYVPAKLQDYCTDAYLDSDGIWFEFNGVDGKIPRFASTDAHVVHEDTINQCREAMRDFWFEDDDEYEP